MADLTGSPLSGCPLSCKSVGRSGLIHPCECMLSHFSHVQLFVTPWTVAHQAPLSIEFSREEYWSGLPCPPPGDLLDWKNPLLLCLLHWQVGSLPLGPPGKPTIINHKVSLNKVQISALLNALITACMKGSLKAEQYRQS